MIVYDDKKIGSLPMIENIMFAYRKDFLDARPLLDVIPPLPDPHFH